MGGVSICQKNCNTIDLRRAQVNECNSAMMREGEKQESRLFQRESQGESQAAYH